MLDDNRLNDIKLISAFTMGVPGKRTFFLAIGEKENWVRVWLEKYLLESLGLAVDKFLTTLSQEKIIVDQGEEEAPPSKDMPVGLPTSELDVDQITLGYDMQKVNLDLIVHPSGPRQDEQKELSYWITVPQLKKLGAQAKIICAAGRPICPKCGNPIDPSGHTCPAGN